MEISRRINMWIHMLFNFLSNVPQIIWGKCKLPSVVFKCCSPVGSCSNCPACEWPLHEEVVSQAWRWVLIRNRWSEVGVYVCVWESDLKNVDQSSKLVGKWDNSIHTHISCFHWTLKPEATQFRELQVTCVHVLVNLSLNYWKEEHRATEWVSIP